MPRMPTRGQLRASQMVRCPRVSTNQQQSASMVSKLPEEETGKRPTRAARLVTSWNGSWWARPVLTTAADRSARLDSAGLHLRPTAPTPATGGGTGHRLGPTMAEDGSTDVVRAAAMMGGGRGGPEWPTQFLPPDTGDGVWDPDPALRTWPD